MFIKRSILFLIFLFSVSLLYFFFLRPAIACTTGNNYNYRPACDCREQCNSYAGGGVYGIACNNSGCDGHTYQCLDIQGGCSGIGGGGAKCNGGYHEECKKSCSPASARDGECWKQHNTVKGTWCRVRDCTQAAPDVPTLLTPANGSVVQTTTGKVTLTWQKINFGKSCNPPQKNTLTLYAGPPNAVDPVYVFSDSTVPVANQATSYVYTIPASVAPGTRITWYLFVNNNCPDLTKTSAKWTFIYQSGISGRIYNDPTNSCSTAQPWNLGGSLIVKSSDGTYANVSGSNGTYTLGTTPGTYNISVSGMPGGYVCSTGCAQACPNATNITSPGTHNFFLTYLPGPWWQVKDGDVESGGDLSSQPPAGTFFDIAGPGGFPGIPTYNGTLSGIGSNNVSEKKWIAASSITTEKVYNYQFFINQVPADILSTFNLINPGDDVAADLTNPGATHDANTNFYYWYKYNGKANGNQPLTIPAVDIGDRKIVLFVDSADVNITGNITLNDGVGFFMIIVGSDENGSGGAINVDAGVGGGAVANLEGLYVADKGFFDGTLKPVSDDTSIHIRGSVVAYNIMSLQRDLGSGNNITPGELFEYAPDQLMLFPKALSIRKINWKEIAP